MKKGSTSYSLGKCKSKPNEIPTRMVIFLKNQKITSTNKNVSNWGPHIVGKECKIITAAVENSLMIPLTDNSTPIIYPK